MLFVVLYRKFRKKTDNQYEKITLIYGFVILPYGL